MDKIEALYNSYIEQGLLSKETTLEQFSQADDAIKQSLYDAGIENKVLSSKTDFDTFSTAWGEKKNPDETAMDSTVEDGSSDLSDEQKAELGIPVAEETDEWGIPKVNGVSVVPPPDEKTSEDKGKGQYDDDGLARTSIGIGMNRFNEAIVSIPNSVYNFFSFPQNLLANQLELPDDHWLRTDDSKFEETLGVKNSVLDYYQEELKKQGDRKADIINKDFGGDGSAVSQIMDGNYMKGFQLMGAGLIESAPVTLGIMASGGTFGAIRTAIGTTVALTEAERQEMKELFPDASEAEIMAKAVQSSAFESLFTTVNMTAIGGLYKDILKREGVEVAGEVVKNGLIEMWKTALKKYGILAGAIGEAIEEVATQMSQNLVKGRPIMEGVPDSFLQGLAGGGLYTAPAQVAQAVQNRADKKKAKLKELAAEDRIPVKEEDIEKLTEEELDDLAKKFPEMKEIEDGMQEVPLEIPAVTEQTQLEKEQAGVYRVPNSEVRVVRLQKGGWVIQDWSKEGDPIAVTDGNFNTKKAAEQWLRENSPADNQAVTNAEDAPQQAIDIVQWRGGVYYDNVSNRVVEKEGSKWKVKNETTGEVYFEGNTLREASEWVESDNREAFDIPKTQTEATAQVEVDKAKNKVKKIQQDRKKAVDAAKESGEDVGDVIGEFQEKEKVARKELISAKYKAEEEAKQKTAKQKKPQVEISPNQAVIENRTSTSDAYKEFAQKEEQIRQLDRDGAITRDQRIDMIVELRNSRTEAIKEIQAQENPTVKEEEALNPEMGLEQELAMVQDALLGDTDAMTEEEISELEQREQQILKIIEDEGMQGQSIVPDGILNILQGKVLRDNNLSDGGSVGQVGKIRKRLGREWRRTVSSTQGLVQSVVRTAEKHHGRITGTTAILKRYLGAWKGITKSINKGAKNQIEKNKRLRTINRFLGGEIVDISFLSDNDVAKLMEMRNALDEQSKALVVRLKEAQDALMERVSVLTKEIEQDQTAEVDANNPLGLEQEIEFDYRQAEMLRVNEKLARLNNLIRTIEGNYGKYLFRQYDAFADPEYLIDLTSANPNRESKRRLDAAIEFVMEEQGVSRAVAKQQLLEYLEGLKGKDGYLSARVDGKMDAPFLRKRKDVPYAIRQLLGESRDPMRNFTSSYYNVSTYLSSITYQQKLASVLEQAGISRDRMQEGYTLFKTNNQGWDFLENVYVPQEFADAMDDFRGLDPIGNKMFQIMVNVTGATKVGKTVLAPTTMMRNFWSGIFLSLNAGVAPFVNGNTKESFRMALNLVPSSNKARAAEVKKLFELGIIGDGAVSGEILAVMNDMSTNFDKLNRTTWLGKGLEGMQKLYALGDDAYKVMGFYVYKERYMKAGMTEEQAEEASATRMRNTFPTYSKLPKNIQALRRFPLIGTFPSFTWEVYRTTINNFKYLYGDLVTRGNDPNLTSEQRKAYRSMAYKQMAGMTVSIATAQALNWFSKAMLGVSDEEEETAKNMAADYQRDSNFVFIKRLDGGLEYIDVTAFFPAETIIKPLRILTEDREGRGQGEKTGRAFGEAVSAFVGIDIFWNTISDLVSNKSSWGQDIYRGKNIMEGITNDTSKVFDYFMTNAGFGGYNNIKEFARANADKLASSPLTEGLVDFFGEKESKYKEYTNMEAWLAMAGFRFSKVDYIQGTANITQGARDDFNQVRMDVLRKMKVGRQRDDISDIVAEEDALNKDVYKEAILGMAGFMNQANREEDPKKRQELEQLMYRSLKRKNFNDSDIAAIRAGTSPLLKQMTNSDLAKRVEEVEDGRLRFEPDKVYEVTKAMAMNAVEFNEKTAQRNMQNMGEYLVEMFGDKLLPENMKNLSPEDKYILNTLKDGGLLQQKANQGYAKWGIEENMYYAVDVYEKLMKEENGK